MNTSPSRPDVPLSVHVAGPDGDTVHTLTLVVDRLVTTAASTSVRCLSSPSSTSAASYPVFLEAYLEAWSKNAVGGVDVVEDDALSQRLLLELLDSVGIDAVGFSGADAFLEDHEPRAVGCRRIDVRMSGQNGLQLHRRVRDLGDRLPTILVTGHATVGMAVDAMCEGAFWFSKKPFDEQRLLDHAQQALDASHGAHAHTCRSELLQARLSLLTSREQDVLDSLLRGHSSKIAAAALRVNKKTVDHHRASIMRKLQVSSLAELIVVALRSQVTRDKYLSPPGDIPANSAAPG